MSDLTIISEAPGKIILFGEYVVLEGAPALVTTVNRHCQVQITPAKGPAITFDATNLDLPVFRLQLNPDGSIQQTENGISRKVKPPTFFLSVLDYVAKHSGRKIPGAGIKINTAGFFHPISGKKLGLGSSAAVTVALMHALNELLSEWSWMRSLFAEALRAHRISQGKMGSGVDIAASVYGGVMKYQMPTEKNQESAVNQLHWPEKLHMLTIWTGTSASTRSLVHRVNQFKETEPASYGQIINEMHRVSEEGAAAFGSGDVDSFLDLVTRFTELEMKLGNSSGAEIVSHIHQELLNIIQNAGGTYKPSGAGGGDIGIAFCKDQNTLEQLRKAVEESSYEILDLTLEQNGVKIIQNYEIS